MSINMKCTFSSHKRSAIGFSIAYIKNNRSRLRFCKIELHKAQRNKAQLICIVFDEQRNKAQAVFYISVRSAIKRNIKFSYQKGCAKCATLLKKVCKRSAAFAIAQVAEIALCPFLSNYNLYVSIVFSDCN